MTGSINDSPRCPYVGLVPYSEEDAHFFFGRENEREIIIANLFASRLTVLYGASGVGKTSVLRAGVVYHLRQTAKRNLDERGRPDFAVVYFNSWADDPLTGLVSEVRKAVAQALNCDPTELSPPGRYLDETLENLAKQVGGHLLIILDQFEESFQYQRGEDVERIFAYQFPKAVNRPDLRANFLVSIREDGLAKLDRFKGVIPELFENRYQVRHLSREAARAAIEKPIQEYNRLYARTGQEISVEPSLVEAVLEQTGRGTKETGRRATAEEVFIEAPILQLVMKGLWNEEMKAGSQSLRLQTLERLGEIQQMVQTHVNAEMSKLNEIEKEAAARVFYHLVTPGGAKIPLSVSDLAQYSRLPEPELTPVLTKLTTGDVRILRHVVPLADSSAPQRFEIFHDKLAEAVLDWRRRYVADAEIRKQVEQQVRQKRRSLLLRRFVPSVLFLLCVIAGLITWGVRKDAQRALSGRLAEQALSNLDAQLDLALLLSLEANRASETIEAKSSLIIGLQKHPYLSTFLRRHKKLISSVAFSPDGETLASCSPDGTVILWDVANRKSSNEFSTGDKVEVTSVAFSPDGETLAVACADKTIKLWNAAAKKELTPLTGHTEWISSVTFSPNGKTLASGSVDGNVVIWNLSSQEQIGLPDAAHRGAEVSSLAFSRDGETLAVACGDKTITLWNLKNRQKRRLTGHAEWISSVAFSPKPNVRILASGSADGTVILWDVADRKPKAKFSTGREASVSSVAFGPDGKTLAVASGDKTITLHDAETGQKLATLTGHATRVSSVAFSPKPNVKILASGSADGTVILWDVAGQNPLGQPLTTTPIGWFSSAALSPDNNMVAWGNEDGTVILWDVTTQKRIGEPLTGHRATVSSVAFSLVGKALASGSADGTVILWDLATRKTQAILIAADKVWVSSVASPDGKTLAVAIGDKPIKLLDAVTKRELASLEGHTAGITSLAFSPYDKTVASGTTDGKVILWDVAARKPLAEFSTGGKLSVLSVAFSPDGKTVTSRNADGTIIVWDLAAQKQIAQLPTHQGALASSVAFSADGKNIVSASVDGTVILWDLSFESLKSRACRRANRNLTDEEWKVYMGGKPRDKSSKTCPDLP